MKLRAQVELRKKQITLLVMRIETCRRNLGHSDAEADEYKENDLDAQLTNAMSALESMAAQFCDAATTLDTVKQCSLDILMEGRNTAGERDTAIVEKGNISDELERKRDELELLTNCVMCQDAQRQTMFKPCNHATLCAPCSQQIMNTPEPRCPLCRKNVVSVHQVFIA